MTKLERLRGMDTFLPNLSGKVARAPELVSNAAQPILTRAGQVPNAVAVEHNELSYTYGELMLRVASIRDALSELNLQPGRVVAVQLPRGFDFVSSVVAIMASGLVFLPIGEGWPPERVNKVLEKTDAGALVCHRASDDITDLPRVATELLRTHQGRVLGAMDLSASDAAYIYFTSGSTGEPKGAVNTHSGLTNHLYAKIEDLSLTATDRVAQNAPASFDISLWQMLAALYVGGVVVVMDDDQVKDPVVFIATVSSKSLTILEVVPSLMMALMIAWESVDRPRNPLRWLMLGGESLKPSLVRRWLSAFPTVPVMNAYGPTEAADDVCHHVVRTVEELRDDAVVVPVGRPLPNTHIAVLIEGPDGWFPAAENQVGEIFASGIGVGTGYVSDAELTRASFFEPPNAQWKWRLYRTGDLGYIDEDGVVTCLGRTDRQVKIRGVRIELDEIESVISSIPGVSQVAAISHRGTSTSRSVRRELVSEPSSPVSERQRLICFVVSSTHGGVPLSEISSRLPSSHVPDEIVSVGEIPRSRNGKVDYNALADNYRVETRATTKFYPHDSVGRVVEDIWARTVGCPPRARDASVLESGGDSLAAIYLSAQLSAKFGCHLSTRMSLNQSLEDIVQFLEANSGSAENFHPSASQVSDADNSVVASEDSTPVTLQQEGVLFHLLLDPGDPYYLYQGELVIEAPVDVPSVREAWQAVGQRYRHFSGRVELAAGGPRIVFGPPALSLREVQLEESSSFVAELEELRRAEIARQWDLEEGPLLSSVLVTLPGRAARLLLTMPELSLDAWGSSIFADDFQREYARALGRNMPETPDRAVQLARFAAQQRSAEFERRLAEDRQYWHSRVADWAPLSPIPGGEGTARVEPSDHGSRLLERGYTSEQLNLASAAQALGVTPFSVALTALSRTLKEDDSNLGTVVGVPHSVRSLPGSDTVSAFLVNMLPYMPVDPMRDLLSEVKANFAQFQEDGEHSQIPLGGIVEQLALRGAIRHGTSPFHVMLNMPNVPPSSTEDIPYVEFVETWTGFAKYPLCVYIQEQSGQLIIQIAFTPAVIDERHAERIFDDFVSTISDVCEAVDLVAR